MNQLRSWLYGRHIHVQDISDADELKSEDGHTKRNKQHGSTETKEVLHTESTLPALLLRAVPLAPGDCLECKLVGTGVMMMTGVVVAASALTARKRNPKLIGFNKAVYYTLCSGLFLESMFTDSSGTVYTGVFCFIGFEAVALCRLFDLGPFDKDGGHVVAEASKQRH